MKVLSVIGISGSGKTTTIENIIKELKKRRYSVGSIKEIHFEEFQIDNETTNTYRHKKAGSELVTARGFHETDVLFQEKLPLDEILRFYDHDFVIIEGVRNENIPKLICAYDEEGIEKDLEPLVFGVSGKISNSKEQYRGLPIINSLEDIEKLVDLIEQKVYDKLPDFPTECCKKCGYSCREFGAKILKGEMKREDCILTQSKISLEINGKKIPIVPFVQSILKNAVVGVVGELEGYKEGKSIKIEINQEKLL